VNSLPAPQKIFRIRRDYNTWVANETLEDYALRYTPRAFRKWSELRVANTALGGVSFLALEAIGGAIALNYGFSNALWAILVVGLITFLTGLPISHYAAKYGVDMDLLTRGAGFGYLGSTVTSLIYASFTFIFFALEAAIMAQAIEMAFGWPLVWCYIVCALLVVPLVTHGITLISRLQAWTQPVWLVLLLWPFAWIAIERPELFGDFVGLTGRTSGASHFDPLMFGAAATVAFSLVVQVGEQVDFLRFLPQKTAANRRRWWAAVLLAGPGWIVPGMAKMLGGAFLAFVALQHEIPLDKALEPTRMYLAAFTEAIGSPGLALAATVVFVIVSQVKINVTNAYAGSLAWSNFFARLTHSHPGRVVWLVFNVLIAVMLMTLGVFTALERVLGLYANIAIAWVGALVADLVINKPLGFSPRGIEFKRAYLYDLNPVGLGAMLSAGVLAVVAYAGLLGPWAEAFSPFIALATALLVSPLLAWATHGRWYLARRHVARWLPGEPVACSVCENSFESEDMASCPAYGAPICSLCCTLESRCHDRCKTGSRAAEQLGALAGLLPLPWAGRFNFRVAQYMAVLLGLCGLLAFALGIVYYQESLSIGSPALQAPLREAFIKVFALLTLGAAVCAWWVVLSSESRFMSQEESSRHNALLQQEIDAHHRTDVALQAAKEAAEAASHAKTRYVAGMTHELRTPLNSILGYAHIVLKNTNVTGMVRDALTTIQRSGEHMHALVDGLLDLARIEAGRLKLDPVPVPLREFLDEVVRMVRPQAAAKGLRFVLETCGRVPEWVSADAKRLRQILINLLGNAVRFTDQGQIVLRVDCRREVLRFEVIDTGIGIAPEDQERIFMPFERGSAGRRTSQPGTGLGLTITHLLTELMGGELKVRSEPGEGSTFSVRLYLREIAAVAASPQRAAAELRPVTGYAGPRRTLLVVDDQPLQRQLLAALLAPLGFVVREAATGHECVESLSHLRPDAVLLDLSMDDIDGWQTARMIRALGYADLPIIIVSANVFERSGDAVAEAQCQGFVAKPVVESKLLAVLARTLALDWQHDDTDDLLGPPPPAPPPRSPLPEPMRPALRQLALLGHAHGLRECLGQIAKGHPTLEDECTHLLQMVEHFDFPALIDHLKEAADV
jgi:signal transduction histidine kinase/CheY-like chemotaxis protein/purine-cytosine permease-like protein